MKGHRADSADGIVQPSHARTFERSGEICNVADSALQIDSAHPVAV